MHSNFPYIHKAQHATGRPDSGHDQVGLRVEFGKFAIVITAAIEPPRPKSGRTATGLRQPFRQISTIIQSEFDHDPTVIRSKSDSDCMVQASPEVQGLAIVSFDVDTEEI